MKPLLINLLLIIFILMQHNGRANVMASTFRTDFNTDNKDAMARREVPLKTMRDFLKRYDTNEKESWTKISDGYVARFTSNDIPHSTYYDKNGEYICTVKNYDEKKMPKDVRVPIRVSYYDYRIVHVTEVAYNTKTAYLVQIKNDEGLYKIIRSVNGEIDVYKEYESMPGTATGEQR
ncbi:hypothetical protein [Foetidibacter luteolus]|uniref:hypothetical protein n=1 Tax=Foetidibacter luteolus TaxID=2608880 RepID=UPI00129B39BE|nr:hypothetical protein [Foetidibacter luteolus]